MNNVIDMPDKTERIEREGKKKNWWSENANGTKSLKHELLAKYILSKHQIVRYPNIHGSLYSYNQNTGLYEEDKSGRQIRSFIRKEEDLKASQVKEVVEYIMDMSPVEEVISSEYIAVNNGLLHIETLEFKPFTPNEFILNKIPTNYNPSAYDSFVDSTLKKVTSYYEPSERNIEEMLGCVLYPKVIVPKMFYLYGKTAHNGKSTILYLIHKTFNLHGGNISSISPQKLATNTFAGSSMYGKFANIVDDQPDSYIEDSGTLKSIITGGYVDIEKKGKDSQSVEMSTVLITASNYFPNFKEHGNQINRRIYIIPCEYDFGSDNERVTEVESMKRLSSDSAREYTLLLAIKGLQRLIANKNVDKLTPNEKAEMNLEEFAEYNDKLSEFFDEYNAKFFRDVKGIDAYKEYIKWCDGNFISTKNRLGKSKFGEEVKRKYNMIYGTKRVEIDGVSKVVKGFKFKSN